MALVSIIRGAVSLSGVLKVSARGDTGGEDGRESLSCSEVLLPTITPGEVEELLLLVMELYVVEE